MDYSPISPFHRFAELVFVGVAAPRAFGRKDRRPVINQNRGWHWQRADYQWEISDDYVRNGLKPAFKFSPPDSMSVDLDFSATYQT